MDFVAQVLTPVVQALMVPIKKHLGFLVSSTNNVREMGTKLKILDARVDDIKVCMQTNNANSRMIPRPVPVWLAEVETIKTEAERIERGGYGCFNMKMRYRAGKQSSDVLKKIADLIKEESEITWNNELIPLAKVISSKKPSTSTPVHDGIRNSFESRDQIFKDALKLLEPGNIKTQMIALCGMGGVGKTTMMDQLKKAVEDSKMFDWVVKVVIGKNADPISIQKAISEKIGEAITETTKDARSERLEKRFSGMSEDGKKKILIILDDVWVELNFKDIGLTSPFPNGFKLLLTSREEQVCTGMGVKNISMLKEIEVNECDSLVNLFPSNPMPLLNHLEELTLSKCNSIEVLFNIDLNHCVEQVTDSSLRSIEVYNMEKLKEVWRIKGANNSRESHPIIGGFHAVQYISIKGCKIFKSICTPATINLRMGALIDIYIENCGTKERTNELVKNSQEQQKIGEAITETTKDARSERLEKRFSRMSEDGKKKILIILDDVWVELNFKDIGLTSPFPNGFKLLLTSRDEKVCTRMGVKISSILRMEVLDAQEAKSFFREVSGLISNVDHELLKIGDDIVKRCGGLPIALKIIASTLRDNYKMDEWEDTLFRLQNKDFQDLENIVNEIFEISYKNLKEDEDRAIFQLSSLFPDDFDIRIEDLLRYGWGLKLFKNVNTLATTRRRTNTCVNNLIRSNLLIKSDRVGCVKMHDLVRDFFLSNFSKFKQASIVNYDNKLEWPTQDTKDSCERILLKCTGMSEFPVDFYYPNLKLLNLMDGNLSQFPHDFYERMEKLEVVAYESMNIPLLSKMQYSTTLRTLCLRSCGPVVDISFYGNLINLEILSFADCGIRKLASTIGKLRKLKLLDLTGCDGLCIDDGVFQNLVNLEELYMISSKRSDTIRFTDTNCAELEKLSMNLLALEVEFFKNKAQPKHVSFKKLERFRISIGCKLEIDNEDSSKNSLRLNTNLNELLECKINELFKKTEQLYLQVRDMNHLEDLSIDSQHSFCNLRALYVFGCEDLTYLFTIPVAKGLSKLEHLEVERCPILESLVHGESDNSGVEVIIFQELKFLKLKDLPRLVCLCNTVNVIELPQPVELILEELPNFTSIFPENKNNNSAMTPLLNKDVIIPKLEILFIRKMENLKQIWPSDEITTSEEVNNISMLKAIEVRECDSLVNLFPSNPMPLLNHLEKLFLYECNSIEVLFNIDLNHCVEQVTNNSLRSIEVYNMEKLKEVWRIKGANNSRESHPIIGGTINLRMEALISIDIRNCGTKERTNELVKNSHEQQVNVISKEEISEFDDNISTVAFTSHAMDTFHQLHYLYLIEYYGVDVVFDIESPSSSQQPLLLPYLEDLYLINMAMLSHVWKCNWNEFFILQKQQPESSFQNLTTIFMSRCNRIKYLFSPLMAKLLSNLKIVKIITCYGIEEVVSNRDDEEMSTSTPTQTNTTLFPNLESLTLHYLGNLKRIGGTATTTEGFKLSEVGNVSWSLCQYSKEILIEWCRTLSSVVPSYAIGQTQKLEVLKVNSCKQMMELFETPPINSCGGGGSTNVDEGPGGANATQAIPRLKDIITLKLPNLQILEIKKCDALEYIFTFSTLESLRHLKELRIKSCRKMREIVKEEHREQTMTSTNVVFPCLKSLTLSNLPNLVGFFLGMNGFQWPLLEDVEIYNCPQMTVFTHGESTSPKLKYIRTSFGKYSHDCGLNFQAGTTLHQTPFPSLDHTSSHATTSEETRWSFHDLIEIDVEDDQTFKKIVPSGGLLQLQKLEKIRVDSCELVEEVFEVALEGTNSGFIESLNVVEFSKLREVYLKSLCSLKYIWKSNQWTEFKFPNLTTLSIYYCQRLEYVFTSSMVGSLLQLQELHIERCDNLEVIVKEDEWDAKEKEITIPHLKLIKLWNLRSLKGFCLGNEAFSWPSLDTLEIKFCPEITIFSKGHLAVPEVTKIVTISGSFYTGEDVNSYIKTKKEEGFKF